MYTIHIIETRKDGSILSNRCWGVYADQSRAEQIAKRMEDEWAATSVVNLSTTPDNEHVYAECGGHVFYTANNRNAQPEYERTECKEFIPTVDRGIAR